MPGRWWGSEGGVCESGRGRGDEGLIGGSSRGGDGAAPRGATGYRWRLGIQPITACLLLVLAMSPTACGQAGIGTFRYGNIYWTSKGSTVSFFLDIIMRRQAGWSYSGTAPDGYAREGDVVTLSATETPQFFYGDNEVERVLRITVDSASVAEDWIRGTLRLPPHTYATPSNKGKAWRAQFTGCCRFTQLKNNAGLDFTLFADVDLTRASQSPRPAGTPVQTVPYHPTMMPSPTIYVPVADPVKGIQWSLGTPAVIGGATRINASAFLAVPLRPLYDLGTSACWTASSGGGCLYGGLSQGPDVVGLTVEGWVKADTAAGGYVLSTGSVPGAACPYTGIEAIRRCAISTLHIRVNATVVSVGHERLLVAPTGSAYTLTQEDASFDVCSSPELCASLKAYDALALGTMTGKWIHIAVTRRPATDRVGCVNSSKVEYAVYVNGIALGTSSGLCGASLPASGLASDASLLFGARFDTNGTAMGPRLDAALTEWRFWNGARSRPQILGTMLARITPLDPVDPTAGSVTPSTFASSSVLMALWDFTVDCPQVVGCPVLMVKAVFPASGPSAALLTAAVYNAGGATTADTDSSGVMFWTTAADTVAGIDPFGKVTLMPSNGAGLYQLTVYISRGGSIARVPVDFMVNVVHSEWSEADAAYKLCPPGAATCGYTRNSFMPSLKIVGDVLMAGECSALYRDSADSATTRDVARFLYPCTVKAYAGFELKLKAIGTDPQRAYDTMGNLTMAMDTTNTMVGFRAGLAPDGLRFKVVQTRSPAVLDMTWTPCDLGGEATVCVEAVDFHYNATRTGQQRSASSKLACARMLIEHDPPPSFVAARSQVAPAVFTIGRTGSFRLLAADINCADAIDVLVSPGGPPLPAEAVIGGVKRAQPGSAEYGCVSTEATVTWAPSYKYGGYNERVCFTAQDAVGGCAAGKRDSVEHCVQIMVKRCVYSMHQDQQLQQVAGIFGLEWINLWSINPQILHPDFIPFGGQSVMVGHIMVMDTRMTMPGDLAKRMGMPLEQLQFLNYGLNMQRPLELGQEVCVVPHSCRGMAQTTAGSIVYADAGVAQQASDAHSLPASDVNGANNRFPLPP